jgi:hypothetical protein
MPCRLISHPEYGGKLLRKVAMYIPDYTDSHYKTRQHTVTTIRMSNLLTVLWTITYKKIYLIHLNPLETLYKSNRLLIPLKLN